MLDTILSYSSTTAITLVEALISLVVSFIAGMLISWTYMHSHEDNHSQSFALTIVLLPAVISGIIMLIGSDIAKAFSLAGAFSIIRFRSAPGDPKDIAFVLFAMAAGLGAGVGLWSFALIFTIVLCVVMFFMARYGFGAVKVPRKQLKITIPEDLDYEVAFKPVFEHYLINYQLTHIKTTAMGSLFQLTYDIQIEEPFAHKAFFDELRVRNGNLNISMTMFPLD